MQKIKEWEITLKDTVSAIVKVFSAIWPKHKGIIVMLILVSMFLSFVPFGTSGAQALLINQLLAKSNPGFTSDIIWLAILMIAMSFIYDMLSSARTLANKRLWTNITEFFELKMFRKRAEIDVATYEDPKFQDLIGKATEKGVWPICNLVDNQFQQITNLIQVITAAVVFLVFDWRFFLLAITPAIPDFIVELKYGKSSWDIWDEDSQVRRKYGSIRRHFMSRHNLIELKIFQNVKKFYDLTVELLKTFNDKQRKLDISAFYWRTASNVISIVLQALLYGWILWLVTHGELKIGTMTFLLGSLSRFQGALSGFFRNLAYQFEWSRYASDIFKVLDTEPLIRPLQGAINVSSGVPPSIEFRDVSFAYPDTDKLILRDINLKIGPGEHLAIVGLNGAGKSTLIKLLMRFYDPTGGLILINDIDLKQLDRESWWSCIAALFQNYANYELPIREIVALGRSDGKGFLTKVVRSAKAVDAHSFITNFPHHYNQMVGKEFDKGIELSEGQSQKIALARSIYRDPRLMILDEPTHSIDASAEAKIFEQLEAKAAGCTQIVISHRFSTVRRSDKICIIEEGVITELGSHKELVINNRTYSKLFRLQAKGYE